MGVGGGAHAGLVGEEAPGYAEAHGLLDADAQGAAQDGLGLEGPDEDGLDGGQQILNVEADGRQGAENVEHGHDGHQFFGDGGDPLHAAQKNEGAHAGDDGAGEDLGHTEGGAESVADGVGLDHVAHEAQGQDDGNGEEYGQELAQPALEGRPDVIDGAAGDFAVFADLLILLGQHRLAVDGGHSEEGGDPHPEDGAGAAGHQGGGAAGDVAGAHLGGNGGGQGLEGAHALLAGLFTLEADVAKDPAHSRTESADLDEPGADGKEYAAAHQQEQ